ncbi:GNAT family N-acetyltransferase [Paenibacillus sp. FSL H7-0756]|uniref:GNAT family N-acetyltransferase n=1 Tax=Paenibacillus sp. FSL H7-0756 TaxID=2954738 RepID=UPI0030F8543C
MDFLIRTAFRGRNPNTKADATAPTVPNFPSASFAFLLNARHFASNPASGRIMQKCGMTYEGTLKDQVHKINAYEDLVYYGIFNPAHPSQ